MAQGMSQPTLGQRLRKIRREKEISQKDLSELVFLTQAQISNIEKGKSETSFDTLQKIAEALSCSVSELLGEQPNARPFATTVKIPVFTVATAASCGAGNALAYADFETEKAIYMERDSFRAWDDSHTPFAVYIEGDSMIGAGFADGDIAVINPAEEVTNAQPALVSWRDNWFIKWIFFNIDGSVELRSANANYAPIFIEAEYANNPDFFRVVGKVVDIVAHKTPRSAY